MRIEDPGGDQRERQTLVTDHDGVPRVVPALEADDEVGLLREIVDNPTLSLVTPLGT